jgi:hypothetical protein
MAADILKAHPPERHRSMVTPLWVPAISTV